MLSVPYLISCNSRARTSVSECRQMTRSASATSTDPRTHALPLLLPFPPLSVFPQKQHFPHRAFSEETEYLNKLLNKEGDAFILGTLQGPRWHLYIVDFNEVDASEYKQQTCELIMFNLDPQIMKQFYQLKAAETTATASSSSSSTGVAPMEEESKEEEEPVEEEEESPTTKEQENRRQE